MTTEPSHSNPSSGSVMYFWNFPIAFPRNAVLNICGYALLYTFLQALVRASRAACASPTTWPPSFSPGFGVWAATIAWAAAARAS